MKSTWLIAVLMVSPMFGDDAGEFARRKEQARQFVVAGKPLEAAAIYDELLRAAPGDRQLLVNLAVALFKAGRHDDVIAVCRKAVGIDPQLGPAWMFLGAGYFEGRRYAEAVQPLQRALELQPGERNSQLMLGEALLILDRPEEALAHLEKLAKALPENVRVLYGLERSYANLAAHFEAELEREAKHSAYWHALMGDAARRQHRWGRAIHHYREALRQSPDLPGIHTAIASVYRQADHADWATIEERRETARTCGDHRACGATARDPAERRFWMAKAYRVSAAEAFKRLESLPPSMQLHELRARHLDALGRYRESAEEWRLALALSPDHPTLLEGLALALLHSRDHAGAIAALTKLLSMTPDDSGLHLLCGRAHLEREDPARALTHLRRAVDLDPESVDAHAALGRVLMRAGQPAKAAPHLEKAAAADTDGAVHYQLGRAYLALGRKQQGSTMMAEYRRLSEAAQSAQRELDRDYPLLPPTAQ